MDPVYTLALQYASAFAFGTVLLLTILYKKAAGEYHWFFRPFVIITSFSLCIYILGGWCNFAVKYANNGKMPVQAFSIRDAMVILYNSHKYVPVTEETRLTFLADIHQGTPWSLSGEPNDGIICSKGDWLISAGQFIAIVCTGYMLLVAVGLRIERFRAWLREEEEDL